MIARVLYLFGLVSIVASVYIYNFTDPLFGMYIGLWAPTFLVMAAYERLCWVGRWISLNGDQIDKIHPKWNPKG